MGGWEWRCFVPAPSVLELPDAVAGCRRAEERTDEYLLVPSDAVGIKLRGGGRARLEVKERKELKARGAEKWGKCSAEKRGDAEAAAVSAADEFMARAGAWQPVPEGAAVAPLWVSVRKRRRQARARTWPSQLVVEQTDIELQLREGTAAGGSFIGKPLRYRSFAVEGGAARQLYEGVSCWLGVGEHETAAQWTDEVVSRLGGAGAVVIGGFPTLLHSLCARFAELKTAADRGQPPAAYPSSANPVEGVPPIVAPEPEPDLQLPKPAPAQEPAPEPAPCK